MRLALRLVRATRESESEPIVIGDTHCARAPPFCSIAVHTCTLALDGVARVYLPITNNYTCGAPKPQRHAARGASSWVAGIFVSRNPYLMGGGRLQHTGTLIYRESFTMIAYSLQTYSAQFHTCIIINFSFFFLLLLHVLLSGVSSLFEEARKEVLHVCGAHCRRLGCLACYCGLLRCIVRHICPRSAN